MLLKIFSWEWIGWLLYAATWPSTVHAPLPVNTIVPQDMRQATTARHLRDTLSLASFPFLNPQIDSLIGRQYLGPFFKRMAALEAGTDEELTIVHIGDSHIQADWWTGYLRTRLQQRFGSAGRGLVFPYLLAETNSPTDLRAGSNQSWEYRRSAYQSKHIPIGIAGLSIQTSGTQVWLDLQVRNDTIIDYAFDRVRVFGAGGPDALNWSIGQFEDAAKIAVAAPPKVYHTVRSGDTLYDLARRYGTRVSLLQQWNNLRGSMIRPGQRLVVGNGRSATADYDRQPFAVQRVLSWEGNTQQDLSETVLLDSLTHRLLMRGRRKEGGQGRARLYGLSLENSRGSGVLYHAIGVNGVTYYHYNEAPAFWEQLPVLKPDLIIVSLGTNEAGHSSFAAGRFSEEVSRFATQLQALGVPVLLTTPPDALRRRRYENPNIRLAGDIIMEVADKHGFAAWDLFRIMGGSGAVQRWKNEQLVARDYLHFTRAGYQLQGELLYHALMRAYAEY